MYAFMLTSPAEPAVVRLIAALDQYQSMLYPAESNHLLDLSMLPAEQVIILLIRHGEKAIGCGAVVMGEDGHGEMKRVFIEPTHRDKQLGERLLVELETVAVQRGCTLLRLETGIHQHAAIRLYTRCGYRSCEAFAPYSPDPLSVFMMKPLASEAHPATQ